MLEMVTPPAGGAAEEGRVDSAVGEGTDLGEAVATGQRCLAAEDTGKRRVERVAAEAGEPVLTDRERESGRTKNC